MLSTSYWTKAVVVALLVTCSASAQIPNSPSARSSNLGTSESFTIHFAVPFAKPEGTELLADLYLPKGIGPFPAVLFIHGGGWSSGDRSQLRRQAQLMARQGMVGMAIDYRLAPADPFPAAIDDARQAAVWLRKHADEYHVDSTRIGAVGSSAGGYLVAMLGVDPGPGKDHESFLSAVVALNGIFDLTTMPPSRMITDFVTKPCADIPSICTEASPVTHVKRGEPRFLIMHGTADQTAPYAQATAFVDALHAAGNSDAKLFSVEGAPHTFWSKPEWAALSDNTMAAFLHRYLDR